MTAQRTNTCAQHHKMLEKSAFFQVMGLLLTLAALAFGFGIVSFASQDSMKSVQKQVDDQKQSMRDLRAEMGLRFDRVEKKLDRLTEMSARRPSR